MTNSLSYQPLSPTRSPRSRAASLALSLATTALAALLLILANKLVGTLGRSAGLKDACWQLTAVRATLAAATVTTLISLRKDNLFLLGAIYGTSLALTHGGLTSLSCALAAGTAAFALRHALTPSATSANAGRTTSPTDRSQPKTLTRRITRFLFPTLLPTLAFVALLSLPSLITKLPKLGLPSASTTWTPDLALRLLAATLTATALTCLWPQKTARH